MSLADRIERILRVKAAEGMGVAVGGRHRRRSGAPKRRRTGSSKNKKAASSNPWIRHVKAVCRQTGMSYKDALSDPRTRATYRG